MEGRNRRERAGRSNYEREKERKKKKKTPRRSGEEEEEEEERAVMFVPGGRASGKIRNSSCFISGSFCWAGIDIDKR